VRLNQMANPAGLPCRRDLSDATVSISPNPAARGSSSPR
jgi:hypothetical protein